MMGICYTVWLTEEFDWQHKNYSKDELKKDILERVPHATFEADFYRWLIINIGKTYPEGVLDDLSFDSMLVTDDCSELIPEKLSQMRGGE